MQQPLLVRPGEVNDLIGALKLLVPDSRLRTILGANAHTEVLRKYTWKHHVAAIVGSVTHVEASIKTNSAVENQVPAVID